MIGALSRKSVQFGAGTIINGNASIVGLTVGSREHQQDMIRAVAAGALKPIVDSEFALADIAEAFRHQESKAHFGKICLAF